VDEFAAEQGGAVGMLVTEAIPDPAGNLNAQLMAAMADNGLEGAKSPVVGFGGAARHAMLLSYEAWPVSVAVTPDLNPATAPLPERNASVAESDAAPILLVISDIDTNGAFVTDTEEALDAAGIHWETVRYGSTAPYFYVPVTTGHQADVWKRAFGAINSLMDNAEMGVAVGTEGYLAFRAPCWRACPCRLSWFFRTGMASTRCRHLRAARRYGRRGHESAHWLGEGVPRRCAQVCSAHPRCLDAVKALPYVDADRVGLTGYCFGGPGAVFDALNGSTLQMDVSFHGGLGNKPNVTTTPPHAAIPILPEWRRGRVGT